MTISATDYSKRVVAFVDILGFGNIIKQLSDNQLLFRDLNYALNRIKYVKDSGSNNNNKLSELEVSVFSDSIVMSGSRNQLPLIVNAAGWLQADLMFVGILVRGGIAEGRTVHKDGILYGEGLISAYKLETKTAVYPRIVFSQSLASSIGSQIRNLTKTDIDSVTYIDPFMFYAGAHGADELLADGWDPREEYFRAVQKPILAGIDQATEEDHLAKYLWLSNKFDAAASNEKYKVAVSPETIIYA